ncbi:MAG TPA: AtpZ/AtpI family protein [Terriglobales bacterium]|nr:AtpZ/AtpI family protein [Terriglobales bacterium]
MKPESELKGRLAAQTERMRRAARERPTLLAQASFFSGLGLAMALPIVAGAYLGHWLDDRLAGYSVRWTVGFLLLGVAIGAFNVYWLIKRTET